MQRLRQARFLARLVLAWFALSLGVAVASPLVQPRTLELVCSGSGAMKLLVKADTGGEAPASHTLDCPLCAAVAPPPPVVAAAEYSPPLAHGLRSIPAARLAAATAAPLPPRGPPASRQA